MKTLLLFWVFLISFQTSARPTFPTFPDSGDVVYERQPEAVLQAWSQALLAEPQHPSYPTFVALCRYQQQYPIWESTLQAIQSEHPEEWRYTRDLADAWFQQGKIVQADSLLIEFDEEPSTDFWLLKAKINFQQQSDAAGQAGYERALALVQTQADAQLILADLLYLISDAEFARYDSTALPGKAQFFRTFWRRRDPTPLTDFNERLPEHFRRLFYARKAYRRFFSNKIQTKPSVFEIKTPGNFDPYKKLELPRGILKQKDVDDQGCIYIRHGKPDDSEKQLIEIKLSRLDPDAFAECIFDTWQYLARNDRREVLYFFCSSGNGFQILSGLLKTEKLEMFNPHFYNADSWRYLELVDENFKAIEEHATLETSDYKYSPRTFEFPYTLVSFKESRLNSLELYFGVPLKEFQPDKNETEMPLQIEKGFALFDTHWEVIDQWKESNQFETRLKIDNWKEHLYLNGRKYHLPTGEYHFALQLDDPVSGKMALYRGNYSLPDYFADSLQLSKIILAKDLQPETPQSLFAKDGVQFTPKFNGLFQRQEPVALYYEIYNLNYNPKGQTKYEVTYSVWPYSKEAEIENPRKKKPIIRTGTRQDGEKRDEKMWMSFDFSEQKKGKYVIEILVKDQVGGAEVRKLVPVEVE